jgi:dolichol-phosphate mannosyltransferase
MAEGLSIVVPFFNEEETVGFVLDEVLRLNPESEVIAVDDGSTDATWRILRERAGVRAVRFRRNQGQSAAFYQGLSLARGRYCGLMDGDGQNDPADFGPMVAQLEREQADAVFGWRKNRQDRLNRKLASRVANGIRRMILDDGIRDTGCSMKVFKREAVAALVPFRGMHRYLPALFKSAGLRIVEAPVNHRPRRAGTSKYSNLGRAIVGVYDLMGVAWLIRRRILRFEMEVHE